MVAGPADRPGRSNRLPDRRRAAAGAGMNDCLYAAYGSNLHPARLAQRVPSARLLGTSVIDGYELRFNKRSFVDGTGKCTIGPGNGVVHTAIFAMTGADKRRLDEWEGLGKGYDDTEIELPEFGVCRTYIAAATALDDDLKPVDWYRELVLLGCQKHRFPADYVRAIERIEAIEDPDRARRRAHWRLVRQLRDAA
jgi:hypothetical protein